MEFISWSGWVVALLGQSSIWFIFKLWNHSSHVRSIKLPKCLERGWSVFLWTQYELSVFQVGKTETPSSRTCHSPRWMISGERSQPPSEPCTAAPRLIYMREPRSGSEPRPPALLRLSLFSSRTLGVPRRLAPDSLRVWAGPEPLNPSSLSSSAAAAVWSMIPLIITATLSPLSHHSNRHSQGQLSADCLHRLGLH